MGDLAARHCVPCSGSTPRISTEAARGLVDELPGWRVAGGALHRRLEVRDFATALSLAGAIGDLAEREAHHPDLCLGWGYLDISLKTHAIDGLSENDFILAAKISRLDAVRAIGPTTTRRGRRS